MAFFYDLYALVGNLRFSEVRVRAATLLGYGNHDAPKRSSVPLPFAGLRCTARARRAFGPRVIRTRIRPLAGAECAPNSNRGRTAGAVCKRRIPATPAAPKRAMRILRLRKIVLLKPGSSRAWGWFQKDTLRVSVVRYDGCAARASGIQLSVYRVSADLALLVFPGLATVDFPAGYHCTVTFPLMLDLSDLECRSSASGVPERTKRWRIAFSVTP